MCTWAPHTTRSWTGRQYQAHEQYYVTTFTRQVELHVSEQWQYCLHVVCPWPYPKRTTMTEEGNKTRLLIVLKNVSSGKTQIRRQRCALPGGTPKLQYDLVQSLCWIYLYMYAELCVLNTVWSRLKIDNIVSTHTGPHSSFKIGFMLLRALHIDA